MKIVLPTSMEKIFYYEIWNYLEKDKFPSKLKRGSQVRKNWIYYIHQKYSIKIEVLSTISRKYLTIAKLVPNILEEK
jgi:hypothetical protein